MAKLIHEIWLEDTGEMLLHTCCLAGPMGRLGYPISDEQDNLIGGVAVGKVSDFENGSIFWTATTGIEVIMAAGPPVPGSEIIVGIDVSVFQGTIDWNAVATRGTTEGEVIQFAYMKATEGDGLQDSRFTTNWTASGGKLLRGAYHFFHATKRPDDARPQTDNFINTLNGTGDPGELPPMVDVESLTGGVTAAEAEASLQFFLSLVEEAFGKRPIIYTFPSFWQHQMADTQTFATGYPLWIANYGAKRADGGFEARRQSPIIPGKWSTFSIWQNAVKPGVAGISGLVDRNTAIIPTGVDLATFLTQVPEG